MQATTQRAGPSTLKPRSRIHTPQAIRPPSHILLSQDPAYNNLLSPAAFSDTESLFSTTSATSTARRKRRRKALQQGSKAAELLRALSKQYPASTVGPLCCVLGLACKALLEAAALYRFNHQTVSEGLETRRIFCHVSNTPLSNWYHGQ